MGWQNKPMRISAVQCNYGEDSISILENHVKKRGFNTDQLLHLFAKGHMGFYDEELHGKRLDEYINKVENSGIRIITYLNVHCMDLDDTNNKESWIQRNSKGEKIGAYNTYFLLCINNDDWLDYYEQNVKKLCKRKIDGVFLDGPLVSPQGCYCSDCQKKFSLKYNKSIFDCDYKEWLDFRVDTVTEFVKKTNSLVKSANTDIVLYLNNESFYASITGHDTKKIEPYVDIIGTEGGFSQAGRNQSLWYTSSRAKYIEMQAKGKPTVIFIAGDQKPYSYYMHTPEETVLMLAQTVSNGANIWYGIHAPTYIMDCPGGKAAEKFMGFLGKNEEYYSKTVSCAKVALMWSVDSSNYYKSTISKTDFTEEQSSGNNVGYGDQNKAFMGVYEIMSRLHVQFDVIDDDSINSGLEDKYELIIIPSTGCMSKNTADKLRKFVSKGGNVVCCFDCSFFAQNGIKYVKPVLSDLLGISEVKGIVGYDLDGCGYISINDSILLDGLSAPVLPSPEFVYDIVPDTETEVLAYSIEPMKSRYTALNAGKYPVILKKQHGEGLCYYLNGTFGEFYYEKSNPDYCKLFKNIILGTSKPLVVTDAPGSAEIIIRKQQENKRLLIHITNMTGEMARPINKIIKLSNIYVSIYIGKAVNKIRSITTDTELSFKTTNDYIEFIIPEINEYELYSIDYNEFV